MSITAKATLKTLDELINELKSAEGIELIQLCVTVDYILDKLEAWSQDSRDAQENHPASSNASGFIVEMKAPLYSLAGLNSYHSDKDQCIVWLMAGLKKLKGVNCFAVKM